MEEFKKLNELLENLKTSSEVSETLLGQLIDQNSKIEDLLNKKDSEEFKLKDFKTDLKRLRESVNKSELIRGKVDLLLTKVDEMRPPVDVVTNTHIMTVLGSMRKEATKNNCVEEKSKKKRGTSFNDYLNRNLKRILIGFYCALIIVLGFIELPNYFLEKQRLDEHYQVLKIFAEVKELKEFYEEQNTDDYDKEIEAIKSKEASYVLNYNKMKAYWNKEHEKSELSIKINQHQEKLKQLQR